MNITLRDLIRWSESPLYAAGLVSASPAEREAPLLHPDRLISWPETMRATTPRLARIEPGALVLLPVATLAEVRAELPAALHDLRRRGVAALVIDPAETIGVREADLDLLRARGGVTPDLEITLARLINERRRRLYNHATELERALTEATLRGRGIGELLRIGVAQSGRAFLLLDEQGRIQDGSLPPGASAPPRPPVPPLGSDVTVAPVPDPLYSVEWLLAPLEGEARGWLALCGPQGALDEVDRLTALRVAAACSLTRSQTQRTRPRLPPSRRAALIGELLRPGLLVGARNEQLDLLGLENAGPAAVLAFAATPDAADPARAIVAACHTAVARISPHAEADEYSNQSGEPGGVLVYNIKLESLPRLTAALRAGFSSPSTAGALAALSTPVDDLAHLPDAARRTQYALAVLRAGALTGPFVDWNSVDDLGAYGLLYSLWGTTEAERFIAAVLGDLPDHDLRYGGELVPTLLAYLRQGGAAGAAADALKIHRNTLTYRLRRIEEICRRSPLNPNYHLAMHLAAILHSLPPPVA